MIIGEKIAGNGPENLDEEKKGLDDFVMLKNLKQWDKIEGFYQGTYESKNKPRKFFHVFKTKEGKSIGYGLTNSILSEKIEKLKKLIEENGGDKNKLYAVITFWGQKPSKNPDNKGYFAFSDPTVYAVKEGSVVEDSAPSDKPETKVNTDFTKEDIPF